MKLIEYLSVRGAQSKLALAVGVTPVIVNQWTHDVRQAPAERCPDIEIATDGAVTCEELRPDVTWIRFHDKSWPHPKGRPLIDHSHKAVA